MESKAKLIGANQGEIAENMVRASAAERVSLAEKGLSPGQRNVAVWLAESAADAVKAWAQRNSSKNLREHPDYIATLKKVMETVCSCHRDAAECKVHGSQTKGSVGIADLIWWVTDAMFDHIPAAVPSFPLALVTKLAGFKTETDISGNIPPFAHFLCVETEVDTWLC